MDLYLRKHFVIVGWSISTTFQTTHPTWLRFSDYLPFPTIIYFDVHESLKWNTDYTVILCAVLYTAVYLRAGAQDKHLYFWKQLPLFCPTIIGAGPWITYIIYSTLFQFILYPFAHSSWCVCWCIACRVQYNVDSHLGDKGMGHKVCFLRWHVPRSPSFKEIHVYISWLRFC